MGRNMVGHAVTTADKPALAPLNEVARRYGLPPLTRTRTMGLWGNTERSHLVAADGREFYLKERAYYLSPAEFGLAVRLQYEAHRRCPNVQAVVPDRRGALAVRHRDRDLALYEWVADKPFQQPIEVAAQQFADLLHALARVDASHRGRWDIPAARGRWYPDRPGLFADYLRYFQTPAGRTLPPSCRRLGTEIGRMAEDAAATVPWHVLPEQFIHGDPSPFHLLGSGPTASWIDFDDARWSYRCWDVARFLFTFLCVRRAEETDPAAFVTAWPETAIARALDAYRTGHRLTNAELVALPRLLPVVAAVTAVSELDLDDAEFELPDGLPQRLEEIAGLVEHPPAL